MIDLPEKIVGKPLSLIPISYEHQDDFIEYSSDPNFYEYLEYKINTITEINNLLDKLIIRNNKKNSYYYFIKLNTTKKVIGTFGIFNINEARKSCEISYGIGKRYQSKGYFQNVLKIVTDEVLIKNNFNRIQATTSEINIPSINGLKKFGFKKEVQIENFYFYPKLGYKNGIILSILAREYKKNKSSD